MYDDAVPLEQSLRDAMRRLETLYGLAEQAGRAKDLTGVCEAAVDAIVAVGASRASVLLFDDQGVMRFHAWRNLSPVYRAAVDGHSPWSRDAADLQPILVEDVLTDPGVAPLREVLVAEGIRSLAFVPLVGHGQQLLGKFMVYYDEAHAFAPSELRLASSIAQHVAFGLTRVLAEASIEGLLRREQAARREAEERRAIAEELTRLARGMTETLDVEAVAQRIVEAAMGLLRGRAAGLRLVAPDGTLVGSIDGMKRLASRLTW